MDVTQPHPSLRIIVSKNIYVKEAVDIGMNFVNLTDHFINVYGAISLPPSGQVARCVDTVKKVGMVDKIPIIQRCHDEIVGLPAPVENTIYIVSATVARIAKRPDVMYPDMQRKTKRGKVTGCDALCVVV